MWGGKHHDADKGNVCGPVREADARIIALYYPWADAYGVAASVFVGASSPKYPEEVFVGGHLFAALYVTHFDAVSIPECSRKRMNYRKRRDWITSTGKIASCIHLLYPGTFE